MMSINQLELAYQHYLLNHAPRIMMAVTLDNVRRVVTQTTGEGR